MGPSADGVQQRRAHASCDLCKRMKIRCEKHGDTCSNCLARAMTCNVTLAPRKPRLKKANQFNSIESRIKRMESLLQSSGIAVDSLPQGPETSYSESIKDQTSSPRAYDLSNLVIGDTGAQKYIGASSGFALLSPRGLSWVEEKTGSNQLEKVLDKLRHEVHLWPQLDMPRWWPGSNFTRHLLPSRDIARQLVDHYFSYFNAVFPLFDRKMFYNHLERHYSNDPPVSKAWYGALNIVLSIGCVTATDSMRFDTVIDGPSSRESFMELSRRFFQNASSVMTDLLIFHNELMGVQTLVGMAFVMQAAMNPEAAFVLIAAAARMGHGLGFHRWLGGFGLSLSELEQRRRVFWIIYIFEKSMSIRIGRPSAINDEDIGVPLPPEDLADEENTGIHVPSTPGRKFYPFRAACAIALVESRVYSELYSARSWTEGPDERLNRVSRLDQELQEWKDKIPLEFRPEHAIQCESEHRFSIIMLHLVYYNCVTTIHRVSVHHGSWTSKAGDAGSEATPPHSSSTPSTCSPPNPRIYESYALCLSAARSTIHIVNHFLGFIEDPRNCLIWIAAYFPLSASLTLFAHILQAPTDPRVGNDLKLMEGALTSLCKPSNTSLKSIANLIFDIFGDLIVIGREHIKKARDSDSTTAPMPHHLRDGIQPPESPSFQYAPHADMESSTIPPPVPSLGGNEFSPAVTPQPVDLSADLMADHAMLEYSSYNPFDFLPDDITDPNPTFMLASEWNQLDPASGMDHEGDFFVMG